MKKKHRGRNGSIIFLCCLLAVPTMEGLLGRYGANPTLEVLRPALTVGALLGLAHLLLRPVLRFLTAPLGCLTFGLFGMVIDVGLLYGCARMVQGFAQPALPAAVATAVLINVVCAVAGGRR